MLRACQDEALKQYLADKKQKQSLGQKIDVVLKAIRVCLVHGDLPQAKKHIETAHECVVPCHAVSRRLPN